MSHAADQDAIDLAIEIKVTAFVRFINDMNEVVDKNTSIASYADDTMGLIINWRDREIL